MSLAAAGVSIRSHGLKKLAWVLATPLFIALILCRPFPPIAGQTAPGAAQLTIAGRKVTIWKPEGAAPPGGYPVILFSHGFTGCATQSLFLTSALAQAGYLVVAPNHRDAGCGTGHDGKLFATLDTARPQTPFRTPEGWSEATYRDRAADLEAILDAILKDESWQGIPIDSSRVGLAGHSLGGYTVLGLAGAWPSWRDPRVKAVLALSPYCAPFVLKGDLAHLDVPVMYQGGTLDIGITPSVRRHGGAYDLTSAPKYFIDFAGAGHFAWTNLNRRYQTAINGYSLWFFNCYLKGVATPDPIPHLLGRPWPKAVSDVRYALK